MEQKETEKTFVTDIAKTLGTEETRITPVDVSTNISMQFDYVRAMSSITPEQKEHYREMTKGIVITNPSTIQSYGQEINKIIARQADTLLDKASANKTNDVVVLTNDLLSEINDVDLTSEKGSGVKNFLKSIPIIRNLVKSGEDLAIRRSTIGKNVREISEKIVSLKTIAMSDNSSLEQMAETTRAYIVELRQKTMSLMVLEDDLKAEIESIESQAEPNLDELQLKRNAVSSISKRITDMNTTEYILQQNMVQIAAMIGNNDVIIQKSDTTVGQIIPIWKQQLAIASITDNQKKAQEISQKMSDAANKMLISNARDLNMNSVALAESNETPMFQADTLRETTNILIDTLNQVKTIHENGEARREEIRTLVRKLSDELAEKIKEM